MIKNKQWEENGNLKEIEIRKDYLERKEDKLKCKQKKIKELVKEK